MLVVAGSLCAAAAPAAPKVNNFALLDQTGRFHELYSHTHKNAIVVIAQGNGCPLLRKAYSFIRELNQEFAPQGVAFFMLNANLQDEAEAITQEVADYGLDLPVLLDPSQIISEKLGITRTTQTLVIDPKTWEVVYEGTVDAQLREALAAKLAHQPLPASTPLIQGCLISRTEAGRPRTYTADVAPILLKHCVRCHRDGGMAPWSMNNYAKVKGWSAMIGEVVLTQSMPPWPQLSPAEVRTLIHWLDQGSLRGTGQDPLERLPQRAQSEWALGKPDLMFTMPKEEEIPATGTDDFRTIVLTEPVPRDIWVRGFELRSSNPKIVHHANVVASLAEVQAQSDDNWFTDSGMGARKGQVVFGYAPGSGAFELPRDTGMFMPKGARLLVRMHYIPSGKPEKDLTHLGIYTHKRKPAHVLSVQTMLDRTLKIPAGAADFLFQGTYVFPKKVVLLAVTPHMHVRGKSMAFTLIYPDGRREPLLSVPRYRFRWQRQYMLQKPKILPAGTKVLLEAVYDNSAQNPDNPDPSVEVQWGPNSGDEMFVGILYYYEK